MLGTALQKFWDNLLDRRFALAHAVLLLGLVATVIEFRIVKKDVEEGAVEEFNRELQINMDSAHEGLLRYVYAVHDVASLIENDPGLSTDAWKRIMRSLEWHQHLPALRDLGYADNQDNATLPVRFVSAGNTNTQDRTGVDLAADPRAREAQRIARESHQPFGYGEEDCILFVPAARGFAFASFKSSDLWFDLLRQIRQSQVELRLLATGQSPPPDSAFCRTVSMTTWGIRWRLVATPRPSFERTTQLGRPPLFLMGGLVLTLFVSAIAYGESWRRIRAQQANEVLERRIEERTAELQLALEREQELSRLKSNFVSTVSHEFRTPLGIIVSSAGILDHYLDRLTPDQRREHLTSIQGSATHMAELMEGALLFSRAEADRIEFNPQPIQLAPLCQHVVDEVASATNRRCPIEFSHDSLPADAHGDEALLRHILTNLLANAVKYSGEGQPVRLNAWGEAGQMVFRIEDSGVGIPAADRQKLFSAFYRGQNVEHIHGTGLGLFIVKKCVDLHGGQIQIESEEGKGTIVTVTLPRSTTQIS